MLGKAETPPPKSSLKAALWWMEGKATMIPKLVCRNRRKWRPFKRWMGSGIDGHESLEKHGRSRSLGVSPCEVTVG